MDQRRPELNPVVTPALTDILGVRQVGDTRDKRETLAQALSLVVEVNDLTAAVVWANIPDANVPESAVTQHAAAVAAATDIADLNDVVQVTPTQYHAVARNAGNTGWESRLLVEADISDLGSYLTAEVNDLSAAVTWANVPQANIPDPLLLGDGSVGAPSYSFAADIDTGFFSNGADQLSLSVGGVEMARFVEVVGSEQALILNNDNTGLPDLGSLGDPDTGLNWDVANGMYVVLGTIRQWNWSSTSYFGQNSGGPLLSNVTASATTPTICPTRGDTNTGLGVGGDDALSLIAGGVEGLRLTELNSGVIQAPAADATITAFATGGQGSAVALKQSYNVISVCASAGDSVKMPPAFIKNSIIHIKNDGAESADVFPASGDNLGQGVDTAEALAAGESASYIATTANATWTPLFAAAGGGVPDPLIIPTGGSAGAPKLAFGDANTGFYESADNTLKVSVGSTARFFWEGNVFGAENSQSAAMINQTPTVIVPTLVPNRADFTTGIGWGAFGEFSLVAGSKEAVTLKNVATAITIDTFGPLRAPDGTLALPTYSFAADIDSGLYSPGADILGLVAGGVSALQLKELNSGVIQVPNASVGVTANAGGGQGSATQLNRSYNVLASVVSAGDSVKLPPTFLINSIIFIKNDGANAADVFPASGDNLGAGVDTAVSIGVGESLSFIALVANATWTPLIVSGGGGGDVTKVGTPVDNQVGVWTGDGTLEGDANFTWDGTSIALGGPILMNITGGPRIQNVAATDLIPNILPNKADINTGIGYVSDDRGALVAGGIAVAAFNELAAHPKFIIDPNDAGTGAPTLVFGSTMAEGFKGGSGTLSVMTGSNVQFRFVGASFRANLAGGGAIENVVASATVPSVRSNSSDVDTGLGAPTLDQISLIAGGVEGIRVTEAAAVITVDVAGELDVTGEIHTNNAAGGAILNEAASDTNPTIIAHRADPLTGLGATNAGELHLIANSIRGLTVKELNGGVLQVPASSTAITAFATGGQASAVTMWSSYNVISVCASAGDSVKLPSAFAVGSLVFVKNDGAQSCDVFPANGDDIGAGTDTAIALAAGASLSFIGTVASTTWTQLVV